MTLKKVIIYTDGACSGNPGPGGWGAVLEYGGHTKEISGFEAVTTNQRMELTAAVRALAALKEPCDVQLYSDSAYLVNAFQQKWLSNWQKNGWRNAQKKPVENMDLWQELISLSAKHRIAWIKVKGHAGNPGNEQCDLLARKAIASGLAGQTDSTILEEKKQCFTKEF
jgi:ribonuclease HI